MNREQGKDAIKGIGDTVKLILECGADDEETAVLYIGCMRYGWNLVCIPILVEAGACPYRSDCMIYFSLTMTFTSRYMW